MSGLSFKKDPRPGQAAAIKAARDQSRRQLIVQLPTGYGKTFTAASIYATLQDQGRVNRLLYLVPSTGQLDQFVRDGSGDMMDAGVIGSPHICDISFAGAAQAVKQHRTGTHQVFACTIQALSSPRVGAIVRELMSTGLWMVCVDECHHYGLDKTWGQSVLTLLWEFLLAMSATPFRPGDDSAFGSPDVVVTYRQAVAEGAVKPLTCHSYEYRIDALEENGEVISYTITDITEKAGSDAPDKVEKIFREMRLSPKYISPMVEAPIERMMLHRLETGHRKLQVLFGAMCCSHAQLVCEMIRSHINSLYQGQLTVDWVGTGENGKSEAENRAILKRFCPDKIDGKRRPEDVELDILVHVGMAGEGLDTIYVSDVVHLNRASLNNSNRQENGRAARFLEGVTGTIHVDSSSDFHPFVGPSIEHSFDHSAIPEDDEKEASNRDGKGQEIGELPDEPQIRIYDMQCIRIIKGEVETMAQAMLSVGGWSEELLKDDAFMKSAEQAYLKMKHRELEQYNERSIVMQWKEKVGAATGLVTSRAIKAIYGSKGRLPASIAGELKRRINTRKKRELGSVDQDVSLLRAHYQWLQRLEKQLIAGELPQWLL